MVGIDGSTAGLRAAVWAADEAAARDTALDLLYVIDPTEVEDLDDALATARHAIHRAWETVAARDRHVKLESEILQGNPVTELANAARRATLICVGHKGTKNSAPMERGLRPPGWRGSRQPPSPWSGGDTRTADRRSTAGWWQWSMKQPNRTRCCRLRSTKRRCGSSSAGAHDVVDDAFSQARSPEGSGNIGAKIDRYLKEARDNPADVQVCAPTSRGSDEPVGTERQHRTALRNRIEPP
jgi:nucleotide-binding universal stress UspA family protein